MQAKECQLEYQPCRTWDLRPHRPPRMLCTPEESLLCKRGEARRGGSGTDGVGVLEQILGTQQLGLEFIGWLLEASEVLEHDPYNFDLPDVSPSPVGGHFQRQEEKKWKAGKY